MNGLPQWQNNKPFISVQDNIKGAYYKAPFLMRSKQAVIVFARLMSLVGLNG
jgi:hypothetical protein